MFKNIQFKIILIFFLVGIIMIGGLGTFYIYSLNTINSQIEAGQVAEIGQITEQINGLKL